MAFPYFALTFSSRSSSMILFPIKKFVIIWIRLTRLNTFIRSTSTNFLTYPYKLSILYSSDKHNSFLPLLSVRSMAPPCCYSYYTDTVCTIHICLRIFFYHFLCSIKLIINSTLSKSFFDKTSLILIEVSFKNKFFFIFFQKRWINQNSYPYSPPVFICKKSL